jgi:glutamyl-tRNA synthetase
MSYRGRLAPTPTGFLHLGHAATFGQAAARARAVGGQLVLRMEDLDAERCRPEFVRAAVEDLAWLGLRWEEGPDVGGPHEPYAQSQRQGFYQEAWQRLWEGGFIFPCRRSRKDMREASLAPHGGEVLYPVAWRPSPEEARQIASPEDWHWRFRVPEGRVVAFRDAHYGKVRATAGVDFGDFPVWRKDGIPAYELAVVVDDAAMGITEVVRGGDLLLSTCRQLLLYEALELSSPSFYHTDLAVNAAGERLAKRAGALALSALRKAGWSAADVWSWIAKPQSAPEEVRREFAGFAPPALWFYQQICVQTEEGAMLQL